MIIFKTAIQIIRFTKLFKNQRDIWEIIEIENWSMQRIFCF